MVIHNESIGESRKNLLKKQKQSLTIYEWQWFINIETILKRQWKSSFEC